MVEWSIEAFRAAKSVRSIVVACPPGHVHAATGDGPQEWGDGDLIVVEGDATRAASVASALRAVDTELVAIHDAARPLLDAALVEAVVATLVADPEAAGAIAAAPVTDTIKAVDATVAAGEEVAGGVARSDRPRVIDATLDRERLWAAQTPQVFRAEALRGALASASATTATDEAMLVEAAGGRVLIHPAPPENLKVTTPLDLRLATLLLAESASSRNKHG